MSEHEKDDRANKLSLWQISNEILALEEKLDELTDEDANAEAVDTFLSTYDETVQARDRKVDNYCSYILHLEAIAKARMEEAERLKTLAEKDLRRARFLKGRLQIFFEQHELKKLETTRHQIVLKRHGGQLPVKLNDVHPEDLPLEFQKVSVAPNLTKIREALEAGRELSFAHLGDRSQSLKIR